MSMPVGLDARLADRIACTAMGRLRPTPGNKILCTKAALKQAILVALDAAHEIGFLAGRKEQPSELSLPASPDRPAWMDIRLDDPDNLAGNHIRFQPVVLSPCAVLATAASATYVAWMAATAATCSTPTPRP